jgi:hypothetical protein
MLWWRGVDVEELHKWHVEKSDIHPCFRRIPDSEVLAEDPAVRIMLEETEESKKVARLGGNKYFAVYERLPDLHAETENAEGGIDGPKFKSHVMQLFE